jgi:fumarate reductase (CoM/CoB) subunit B
MLDEFKREIEYCTYCPKLCRFACPVSNAEFRETVTPTGKQTFLYLLRQGAVQLNQEIASVFYKCTECLRCHQYCEHKIEVPPALRAGREIVIKEEACPPGIKELRSSFEQYANPFKEDLARKLRDIVPQKYFVPEAQVVYFPGCRAINYFPRNIADTFTVLEKAGVDYVSAYGQEKLCCGWLLYCLGDSKGFKEIAQEHYQSLSRYRMIISGCPACVYALKVKYAELGLTLKKVIHISEFLRDLIEERKLTLNPQVKDMIVYHDPCFLGRYLEVYDEPREVLSGICAHPLQEFSEIKEDSICCGGGGVFPYSSPETAQEVTRKRLEELDGTEVKTLVTTCPSCELMFSRVGKGIEVKDLLNIIAENL